MEQARAASGATTREASVAEKAAARTLVRTLRARTTLLSMR
jgi:hypothetical protein